MPNQLIQQLFTYIQFAPSEWQIKYNGGISRQLKIVTDLLDKEGKSIRKSCGKIKTKITYKDNPDWYKNKTEEASFNGVMFRENKVFLMNIYTFDPDNNYKESYLDITKIFRRLLKQYNIYHLCIIIPKAVKKFYADSLATENLIPYLIYDRPYRLPKLRTKIINNHSKHRKFVIGRRDDRDRIWTQIFNKALGKIGNLSTFAEQRDERPGSLPYIYTEEPELRTPKYSNKPSNDLPPKGERKPRRRFGAFGTETWRTDWGNNPNT